MRRVDNPPLRYDERQFEWDPDREWDHDEAPFAKLEVFEQTTTNALSKNTSPDISFTWSINPYRGCFHACAYCYARPTHQYLGFGAGTDFDRRLVAKTNIHERLEVAFKRKSWVGETLVFSGNTDCYQPLEARYGLTRRCLDVCARYRNPVSVITKSKLIRRDIDVLRALHETARCHVTLSVPFLDAPMARAIEPNAASPKARLETVRALAEAGIPVGISIGPIIPGLSEEQIPAILEAAAKAGASWAFGILLRLPAEVRPVFEARLEQAFPLRAAKVMSAIREMRWGKTYEANFGKRMRGHGPRWDAIASLFELHRKRLGLDLRVAGAAHEGPTTFARETRQLNLFQA